MATKDKDAVDQAARLDEIGFPEFTAKLINSTFDALIIANLKQVESYIALVEQVSKSLTVYVNDTKEDIGGAEVLQFLEAVLPAAAKGGAALPPAANSENDSKALKGAELSSDDAETLTKAVEVPTEVVETSPVIEEGVLDGNKWTALLDAVAQRIAVNKYTLLQEMVKQGMLRLVVTNGTIESRMTFTTYGSSAYTRNTSDYQRQFTNKRSSAGAGFIFAPFFHAKERTYSTRLSIKTTKDTQQDNSGSRVQIFGRVVINFKTDYQPLS